MKISPTFLVTEPELPRVIHPPAKYGSRERQGKAVGASCSHLCQRDPLQGPHPLRAGLGGELLPQTQLPMAVLPPREELAI